MIIRSIILATTLIVGFGAVKAQEPLDGPNRIFKDTWTFLMETKNSSGRWVQFAKDELKRGS